ncbi:MAG: CocE/NonD family hydrolase [Actinomycetota bacterium]|nr:CocE/NonD family hydrolase [Actinomycetota bacterium]
MRGRAGLTLVVATVAFACLTGAAAAAPSFDANGSAEQVYATGLDPGIRATLVDGRGRRVASKQADAQGGLLFRKVKPGGGYRVTLPDGTQSDPLTVMTTEPDPPSTDIYDQEIPRSGYGYLTTRDGIKLAIYVHPPQDVSGAFPTGYLPAAPSGPTPTLIEYSGYGYANPAGPNSGISILANIMGFTVVDVNMRGTGCSGGAFDFFEPLQNLDGYDIIETVARQPWVLHNKVGMMGISYGGISQLFTAQTRPPSLAAISPLSVIDQVQTTLYPGGILNTGFAVEWAKQRQREAMPAGPNQGQAWAWKRIQEGDQVCKDNQALHGQAEDLMAKVRANDHYNPEVVDPLSPITFVDKINVPVFMACQWQDEQTGGHCPTLASRMTGTDRKWFTFTNGTHVDSLDPETFNRWYDFLQLYVAKQAPATNAAAIRLAAPLIYQEAMGVQGVMLPRDPIQEQPTYESALAEFEKLGSVRVLFDNGAGGDEPGAPLPGYERSFESFPVPGTTGRSWFFSSRRALREKPPSRGLKTSFTWDARARPLTNFTGDTAAGEDGLWTATPPYKWQQPPDGSAVSFLSSPLKEDTTVVGSGYVRAWVRSSSPSVDLQATVTEVRPDGKETFVQNGWLRADMRKLDAAKSRPLEPVLSLRARDVAPLPKGRFAKVTIPLYYQGHAYRAGSRLRVTITAPNGDQPVWSFNEPDPNGPTDVTIAYSKRRPSSITLPVVPGVDVPTELPPCPSLRAQPCREYQPIANRRAR